MVHLVRKIRNKIVYLYLSQRKRINGKSKVVWQKYLGREDKIKDLMVLSSSRLETEISDFGLPVVLFEMARELQIVDIINNETNKRNQGINVGEYMLIAILNRCIKPTSKAQIKEWFDSTYLQKLFPEFDTYLDSNAYLNHFPYLSEESIDKIELEISKILISKFNVKMDELFFDPTNFYTFINPKEDQKLPKHGKSKENRNVLNLISMSLICINDGGIPIMHQTYPGNVQDAKHFKNRLPAILKRVDDLGLERDIITLVFDKGNLSEDAFKEIKASGLKFICSIRPSTQKEFADIKKDEFTLQKLPNGKEVGALEFEREIYENKYRIIVSYNPNKNKWSGNIKTNKINKINKRIDEVHNWFGTRLKKHKWRDPENVLTKIESIIGKKDYFNYLDYGVSGDYENVKYWIRIKKKYLKDHLDKLGKSYYATNHRNKTALELIWLYRQQYNVEHAFRYIKKPNLIQIRPMYHRNDTSIRGHVFTCVLALLLLTLVQRKVSQEFEDFTSLKIVKLLSEIKSVKIISNKKSIYTIANASQEAKNLANYFNLYTKLNSDDS